MTTPVVTARLVLTVDYFDNHDIDSAGKVYESEWPTLQFDKEDWEGDATFVDGFMGGGRCVGLAL